MNKKTLEIEIKVEKLDKRIVTMAKLRNGCTCWGPWFKDR